MRPEAKEMNEMFNERYNIKFKPSKLNVICSQTEQKWGLGSKHLLLSSWGLGAPRPIGYPSG